MKTKRNQKISSSKVTVLLVVVVVHVGVVFVAAVAVLSASRFLSLSVSLSLHFTANTQTHALSFSRSLYLVLSRSLRKLFRMPRTRRYFGYVKNASIEPRQRAHSPSRRRPFSQSQTKASMSIPDLTRNHERSA